MHSQVAKDSWLRKMGTYLLNIMDRSCAFAMQNM